MPWLARALLRPLRAARNPPPALALAVARLWGAPQQAAVALCGIVASTSLMVAMAVMVTSFRGSVDEWILEVLPADVYLRLEDAGAVFDLALQARVAAAPQVKAVEFRRSLPLRLQADRPPVRLVARDVDRARPDKSLPLLGRGAPIPPGATPAWVSEPMARIYGLKPGDALTLPIGAAGAARVVVAGVWRDYANQAGSVALAGEDYTRLTGDALRTEAAIDLVPGAAPGAAIDALRRILPPQTVVAQPQQLRALALRIFDRSFAVTYALEAIAIAVGLAGVAATFSAQTLARRKEFGVLRHLGVRRGEIVAMLAAEGAMLGAIGAVAGIALGAAMSQVLIHVVNPQSFHWTMETRLPWTLLFGLAIALTATSAATAVLAGRGALSAAAVRAVREDW